MTPRAKATEKMPRGDVVALRPALLPDRAAAAYIGRSPSWIRQKRAADVKAKAEGRPISGPEWIVIERSVFYRLDAPIAGSRRRRSRAQSSRAAAFRSRSAALARRPRSDGNRLRAVGG